ncbi:MAG: plasmid stabilization protein [Bacillus sp. (in: firmicutes)]
MPHKMTLTGKPVSSLRQKGTYHTFDMEENGSPGAPKGLPKSSTITYTVFINQKQLKKAGLTEDNIQTQKIMVQGEPTLDVPIEDCPGEIGVVCFQISIIPEKQKEKELSKDNQEPEKNEVKAEVKTEEKPKGPEGTEDFILLKQISVPEEFLNSHPNPVKTQQVMDYVKQTGYLDEPIIINRDTKGLTDGYRRYIVAKEMKIDLVPVAYEK